MPRRHASASCVSPQLQTWGGLSSALSFKNTSQALNIYYLPPLLRCGAAQPSERTAWFFWGGVFPQRCWKSSRDFTDGPQTDKVYLAAVTARPSDLNEPAAVSNIPLRLDRLDKKNTKQNKPGYFVWVLLNNFFLFFAPPTTAAKPTWHFPEKRSNYFKEQLRRTHCSSSIVALFH